MQILSKSKHIVGILLFVLCIPQSVFAIELSTNPLLISKEHKKKFALRGTRGKPGHQGPSGSSSANPGPTGPQGPQGITGATGADSASFASSNGYAFKATPLAQPLPAGVAIVPFNTTSLTDGVSYDGINTFTVSTAGQYRIYYMLNLTCSGFTTADTIQTTIGINGIGQPATIVSITPTANISSKIIFTMYEGILTLNANDQINVFYNSTRASSLSDSSGAVFVISKLD